MHEYTVHRRQVKSFENAVLEPFFLVINSAACWEKACKKKKKRKRSKLKTQQTQRGSKLSLYVMERVKEKVKRFPEK